MLFAIVLLVLVIAALLGNVNAIKQLLYFAFMLGVAVLLGGGMISLFFG